MRVSLDGGHLMEAGGHALSAAPPDTVRYSPGFLARGYSCTNGRTAVRRGEGDARLVMLMANIKQRRFTYSVFYTTGRTNRHILWSMLHTADIPHIHVFAVTA